MELQDGSMGQNSARSYTPSRKAVVITRHFPKLTNLIQIRQEDFESRSDFPFSGLPTMDKQ